MTIRKSGTAVWLRIVCAVLLLSLGFGHKPLFAQPTLSATDAAFVLPDGSFSVLCLSDSADGKPAKSGWHGCEACLVVSGALLPLPSADHVPANGHLRAIDFPRHAVLLDRYGGRPGSPVRGPPSTSA